MSVGLLVIVRNEIERIRDFLDYHLPFVDEISICDQMSDDGTYEVLQEYEKSSKIPFYLTRDDIGGTPEPSKQKTSEKLNSEWILYVDVDERFPLDFLKKMKKMLKDNDKRYDGYIFKRDNYFLVTIFDENVPIEPKKLWVKHPSEDSQLRLTRRRLSNFPDILHKRVRVDGKTSGDRIKVLKDAIEHRKTLEEQYEANRRYKKIHESY